MSETGDIGEKAIGFGQRVINLLRPPGNKAATDTPGEQKVLTGIDLEKAQAEAYLKKIGID